jgi:Flp pilus assembly pilin Flp
VPEQRPTARRLLSAAGALIAVRSRGEGGAAAVEFALLLPLLVALLFGFIQFGIAFNDRIQATNAAREAARLAVVGIDDWGNVGGAPFWQTVKEASGLGTITDCTLTTDGEVGGTLSGSFNYPITLAIPFVPNASPDTGTARASMRIEQLSAPAGPGGC